jgi:hypothetical protein
MAELIPMQYRLRTAQKQHLNKWVLIGVVAVGLSLASLTYAYMLQRRETSVLSAGKAQVQQKSIAISESRQVLGRRQALAIRMQKVEQLMDDRTLLALLRNISDGFAATDCLEYISIDAKPRAKEKETAPVDGSYVVHIVGITASNTTLADLVTRLSKQTTPAMNVVLQSSHRETLQDGQVMRFEIQCEKPAPSGT